MFKSSTEPHFGSSDIANDSQHQNVAPVRTVANGTTSESEDRDKYKRKIAAMISGVSSEIEQRRPHTPTAVQPTNSQPSQPTASDLRILKAKALVHSSSQSDSEGAAAGPLPFNKAHFIAENVAQSAGHSRSSSQSGSMCNLLGASSAFGGSQTSLTAFNAVPNSSSATSLPQTSSMPPSTSKPSFRVNMAALLNDPRPGKRPIYLFSKLYGESFEKSASLPVPALSNHIYNNPSTRDHSKYLKAIKKRSAQYQIKSERNPVVDRPSSPTSQDLSSIPPEFFQQTFSLSNPDTFYSLFSWLRSSNKALDSATISEANRMQSQTLHDRLSSYLDVVEAEISRQVSSRSDSFFATMTSQDVLQAYLSQTLQAVRALRTKLKNVRASFVEAPLQVMRLSATRDRQVALFKRLRLISTIAGTQSTIQVLLSSGDYSGAIDLIRTTQEVIAEDLNGVVAFRYLPVQLAEVERTIDTMLCDEIRDCLARELNRFESTASVVQDESKLIGIALGLLKLHRFVFLEALQEEATSAGKSIIKSTVVQSVSSSSTVASSKHNASLDDQLRQLAPDEWLGLVQSIFSNLSSLLEKIQVIKNLLSDLVYLAAGKKDPNNVQLNSEPTSTTLIIAEEDSQNLRLPETVFLKLKAQFIDSAYAISDQIQQRCIKVLEIRQQRTSSDKSSVTDFLMFTSIAETFIGRLAEFLERPTRTLPAGSPLPAFVHCQTARFISQFHEERRHKLAEILDTEIWKPAVVPVEFQRLIDVISENQRLALLPNSASNDSNLSDGSDVGVSTPTKAIRINGDEYCVAGTALMLFRLIVDYGDCASKLSSSAGDLLNKLVELLKTYNSRTCQLVLGAGAVQLLGLRTITAGHLALSARSLQFVLCLFPIVRVHFQAVISSEPALAGIPLAKYMDQLEHDYADHVNEIQSKILSVVDSAIAEQFVTWEAKPPVPSPLVKTVCGQLKRLHESLANVIPIQSRAVIFGKVSQSFRDQMIQRLRQLDIKMDTNTSACGIVSQEIAFFNAEIRSFNLGVANLSIGDFMTKQGKPS